MSVIICAHRGSSGNAPENTLAALRMAVEHGAAQAEVDAQLTADGQVVLLHDETLERTTSGTGPVVEHTLEQLAGLDAGAWMGPEWRGQRVPTLEAALAELGDRLSFNIELKGAAVPGQEADLEDKVVGLVAARNLVQSCLLTSFDHARIDRLGASYPNEMLGYIVPPLAPWEELLDHPGQVLSLHAALVERTVVERAHAAGKQVHVWTVNTAAEFRLMLAAGADALITNFPDRLSAFLARG